MEIIKQWIVKGTHLLMLSDGSYVISSNTKWGVKYIGVENSWAKELIKQ
tara:strand:+ start:364 stop:510 length:147 start_codon:yes stop_codon:yes gene_type:complete